MYGTKNKPWILLGLPALLLIFTPGAYAQGLDFEVTGTVYSAQALEEGQSPPRHPIPIDDRFTTDPNAGGGFVTLVSKVIGGESLYPIQELGMVRLSLEDAEANRELASAVLTDNSSYHLKFTLPLRIEIDPSRPRVVLPGAPPPRPAHRVRFVVRDAATRVLLLRSEPVTLWAGSNERWVLVDTEPREIGQPKDQAPQGSFHFTRVGRIPSHWITTDGLAKSISSEPISRYIPDYQNAPFGGTLLLFGGFDPTVYQQAEDYCYQVLLDGRPLTGPLVKTRYTVQGGRSRAEAVTLTPTNPWVPHCYKPTPISSQTAGTTVFWNYPDLVAVWPTGGSSERVVVSVQLFRRGNTQPVSLRDVKSDVTNRSVSELILRINNEPLKLAWTDIRVAATGRNLAEKDNACPIAHLVNNSALDVDFTVEHPFVKRWSFVLQRNLGATVYSDSGVSKRPDSELALRIVAGVFPESCAYQFGVHAVAKTTNGYGYLFRRSIHAAYYLTR